MIDKEALDKTIQEAIEVLDSYLELVEFVANYNAPLPGTAVLHSYEIIQQHLYRAQDCIRKETPPQPESPEPPRRSAYGKGLAQSPDTAARGIFRIKGVAAPPPPNNYGVKYGEIEGHLIADSALDACARFGPTIRQPGLDGPFTVTDLKTGEVTEIKSIREALRGE